MDEPTAKTPDEPPSPLGEPGATLRVLQPAVGVLAFYDGRIPGRRLFSSEPNWIDDGAFELGIASYAIVDGEEALVYDTHISLAHARTIRCRLEAMGVRRMRVVLSHWHLDHVAGNAVFADCEIIAHARTAALLQVHRAAIEAGTQSGPPTLAPLILPTTVYEGGMRLRVGGIPVELRHADVHSEDGTVLLLPETKLLLAGDTLEDTITYVDEPDRLPHHLADLARMASWDVTRILPNHGAEAVIAGGGYGPGLIAATRRYVERLLRSRADAELRTLDLRAFIGEDLASGELNYFAPYEAVHRGNIAAVA